jgi:hypothetical protein
VLLEPRQVALVGGGVRDRQEALGVQTVGDEVVEHAAVLAAQHRVLRAADAHRADVVGEQALQQLQGLRAAGLDLAHVRDVEHAGRLAHGEVLLLDAVVLHGHLPAGEVDQPRAGGEVAVEQDGAAEGRRRRGGHGAKASERPR